MRAGLVFLGVVLLAAPAGAQTAAAVERALLPLKAGVLADVPDTFWSGLAFVRAEEDRQRSLRADITFGLTGDETDSRSLFRLNTGIALARAAFPSEVTVVNRLNLLLRDGEVQEDVTNLQISYDYHAGRHLEYFAFAERFADNFLSIQQRYEVGFGLRAGVTLGHVGPWRETEARFAAVDGPLPRVAEAVTRSAPPGAPPALLPADVDRLTTAMGYLRDSFRERQARLFLGLATSVFAEVERAELDVLTTPLPGVAGTATRVKVPLPGTHRYRVSLRPTVRLRPSRDVLITVLPYYKLPLDGPRRVLRDGERRLDYRRDLLSEMVWAIRQDQAGLENVDLVATLSHFYDNVPPALAPAALAEAAESGRAYARTVADESHRFVTISLRLRW